MKPHLPTALAVKPQVHPITPSAPVGSARRARWSWAKRAGQHAAPVPSTPLPRQPGTRLFRTHSLGVLLGALLAGLLVPTLAAAEAGKIRVLLVAGGHDYETNAFHALFKANPDITFEAVTHPLAYPKLRPEAAKGFDVLVLYDMWQKITDEAKTDLVNFLKSGKGLVALHHSIANYQQWPEWPRIVGGRYYLEKTVVDGVEKPRSIWKHDVKFKVRLADPNHPVTRGLSDFEIHDETYGLFDMAPDSHLLLTTDEPTSARHIGWARHYEGARVVYLQLGHDHFAYENPHYRQLVRQAIRWVARRS